MMGDELSLYKKISDFGRRHSQIVAIYVFGSMAKGKYRTESDIDIAIMVQGSVGGMERVQLETSLSNLLRKDVDLIIFGDASPLLQHQILKYSHIVFESDSKERVKQEVAARHEYLDSTGLYKVIKG
jgi:predicted nucleotidyltransferase